MDAKTLRQNGLKALDQARAALERGDEKMFQDLYQRAAGLLARASREMIDAP